MMKNLIKNPILNWGISVFICLICYLPESYGHPWSFLEKDIDETIKIKLQLKWTNQFQFAGYYMAKEKGFYKQKGLDVELMEATSYTDPVQNVLQGNAQFGVGTSSLLLYREKAQPIVVLSVIFQHSPLVFLMKKEKIQQKNLQELIGKNVMIEPLSEELIAYLKKEKIDLKQLNIVSHPMTLDDLIQDKIHAVSTYSTTTPFWLERANIPYVMLTPRSAGIDFYGDMLFTTEDYIENHPDVVAHFREASLAGWNYALKHPEETIALILKKYNTKNLPKEFLQFEYRKIVELLQPDLMEVGYMTRARWKRIANIYAGLGMYPKDKEIEEQFFYDYYEKNYYSLKRYSPVKIMFLLFGLAVIIGIFIYIKSQLKRQTVRREIVENSLKLSQEKYHSVYDHAPVALIIWDKKCCVLDWNEYAEQLFGWTKKEMLNQTMMRLVPESENEKINQMMTELFNQTQQHSQHLINYNCTKYGKLILCEWENTILWNERNEFIAAISLGRDITEKYHAEQSLKNREKHYAQLLEYFPFPIVMIDLENDLLHFCNRKAVSYLDLPDNWNNYKWSVLFADDNSVHRIQLLLKNIDIIKQQEVEATLKCFSNEKQVFQALLSLRVVQCDSKKILFMAFDHIAGQDRFKKDLLSADLLLHHILDTMNQAIVLFDNKLNILSYNTSFQRLFRFSDEELTPPLNGEKLIQSWLKRSKHHLSASRKIKEQLQARQILNYRFSQVFKDNQSQGSEYERSSTKQIIQSLHYPLDENRFLRTYVDITDFLTLLDEVQQLEPRLKQIIDVIPCAILVYQTESKKLYYANKLAQSMFGIQPHQNLEQTCITDYLTVEEIYKDEAPLSEYKAFIKNLAEETKRVVRIRYAHLDFNCHHLTIAGIVDVTESYYQAEKLQELNTILARQFLEIQALQLQLTDKAILDTLTGVFNRFYLDQQIEKELEKAQLENYPVSFIFIDIDELTQYNLTYGEEVGNFLIRYVADFLKIICLGKTRLFRYSEDQFLVLSLGMSLSHAMRMAQMIQKSIQQEQVCFGAFEFKITLSLSVVTFPQHGDDFATLMDQAENGIQTVKKTGGNAIFVMKKEINTTPSLIKE